jgi:ribosomal-protein-alanine N-acetyltransferase
LTPPPRILTDRLEIRPFRAGDAPGIHAYASEAETTRFMAWPRHRSLAESERVLTYFLACYGGTEDQPLAVIGRSDQRLVGSVGYQRLASTRPWVSWIFASAHWGRGFATEAVRALLQWGWEAWPGWERIEAPIHPGNARSAGLARRLGFMEVPSDLKFKMCNLSGEVETADLWSLSRG